MTLVIRTLQVVIRTFLKPKLKSISEPTRESFRVWPIDIDAYAHMNHAKYLNYMESVRWGIQIRSGFLRLALKQGWIGPLASVHVEYYRPLKLFQKFTIETQFIHFEEKWYYLIQRFWSGDKEITRALIKGTVRKGRENIPPEVYLRSLNFHETDVTMPADIKDWIHLQLNK